VNLDDLKDWVREEQKLFGKLHGLDPIRTGAPTARLLRLAGIYSGHEPSATKPFQVVWVTC
jgi:hypothetical protein